ncbi:MAG: class I SAM-dependent methyltransferase [Candidatus Zipacnadales bacterium]
MVSERIERPEDVDKVHRQRYEFAAAHVYGKRVLDAACGIGYGSAILKTAGAASVCGVDISEAAISVARQYYHLEGIDFRIADCFEITGKYDIAVSLETIEHLDNGFAWPAKLASLLEENGMAIISTPVRLLGHTLYSQPNNPSHRREWSIDEFADLLEESFAKVAFAFQGVSYPSTGGNALARLRERLATGLRIRAHARFPDQPVLSLTQWFDEYPYVRPKYMIAICSRPRQN